MVDVVLGEGFVHADAEEIEHGRTVGQVREGGAEEVGVGVARRVRHGVLAQHAVGIVAQAGTEMLGDVAVDHRAGLSDLPEVFAVPGEVRRSVAEPFHVHGAVRIVEGMARVVCAAQHVVAQRFLDLLHALGDEADGRVLVEQQRIDVQARVRRGGRGAAVGTQTADVERTPFVEPVVLEVGVRPIGRAANRTTAWRRR